MKTKFLVLTFFVFFLAAQNTYAHEVENEKKVIHMTSSGFLPNTIEINAGETVIFENTDVNDHWPASDDHPGHTLYDGSMLSDHCDGTKSSFDACAAVKPGKNWSFTFEKSGDFGFHDHLWSQFSGIVKVNSLTEVTREEPEKTTFLDNFKTWNRNIILKIFSFFDKKTKSQKSVIQRGETNNEKYNNLKNEFEGIVINSDPSVAIRKLEERSQTDGYILSICHDLLHDIGTNSYQKYGNFDESSKYQSDFCNSGYIHGVFESYFNDKGNNLDSVLGLCDKYSNGNRFNLWQCVHGAGHGIMYLTGGDLPHSLNLCETTFSGVNTKTCKNGVYMEVFNSEKLANEDKYVNKDDPLQTCKSQKNDKEDCYLYLPTYYLQTLKTPYSDMFSICDKSEKTFRKVCIEGIGSEVMKRNMNDVDKVFDFCDTAKSFSDSQYCVSGAAGIYVFQKGTYDEGINLCKSAPLKYKISCKNSVSNTRWFFD